MYIKQTSINEFHSIFEKSIFYMQLLLFFGVLLFKMLVQNDFK